MAIVLPLALLSCDSQTAPGRGTASVAITGASVDNGGTWFMGLGVDVTLRVTATPELLASSRSANPYVGAGRLPFYLCFSADGVHFTSQCQSGLGINEVQARVIGPSESFNIRETTHLIAFVIPPEEYGVPVWHSVQASRFPLCTPVSATGVVGCAVTPAADQPHSIGGNWWRLSQRWKPK